MMKISDTIGFLQDIKRRYGDIDLMMVNENGSGHIAAMAHLNGGISYIVQDIVEERSQEK